MKQQQEQARKKNAINHMLSLAQRTEENSIQTQKEIYKQGEQLTRIEDKIGQLDKETDKTKKLSRQIYSFWYYLKDRVKDKFKGKGQEPEAKQQVARTSMPGQQQNGVKMPQPTDQELTEDAALEIMTQKMRAAKKMQKEIGSQIDNHNKRIDGIQVKSDKINDKIAQSRKMLEKRLN